VRKEKDIPDLGLVDRIVCEAFYPDVELLEKKKKKKECTLLAYIV
jgi:hypothetical protein